MFVVGLKVLHERDFEKKGAVHQCTAPFKSALAGSPNVLPFGERKSTRYAGEIRSLSKEHRLSDIMTSVQAVKKKRKVMLYGKQFSTYKMGVQVSYQTV